MRKRRRMWIFEKASKINKIPMGTPIFMWMPKLGENHWR